MIVTEAGISYVYNDDEQSTKKKHETVTASSTIVDQQGILKYVIYPRYLYRPLMNDEQKSMSLMMKKDKPNRFEVPIENKKRINHFKEEFSVVFYWSIPLKARLLQIPTKSSFTIENLNPFQYHSMKISIGTQNGNLSSEIALSNSDDTLDSLSSNRIGILKKKKFDFNKSENNEKRFCFEQGLNEENRMKNMILENVNLCVDNLSKILSESCSNTEEQLTTLQNNQSIAQQISNNTYAKFFQTAEDLNSNRERLPDGVIIHRGEQFGIALGEPMIRKFSIGSFHSINELDRLFSETNRFLMQQYRIESIEDLIQLYFQYGHNQFTELMINRFQVNPFIVNQFNLIFQQLKHV